MKALVKWNGPRGRLLAYEVPEGTKVGASVELPRPWFLDNSSGRMDPLPQGVVTEFGSGGYDGPCVKVIRVIEARTLGRAIK